MIQCGEYEKEHPMQNHTTPIKIHTDSELAHRLQEAARSKRPVRVDIGAAIYSVAADEEPAGALPVPTSEQAAATIAAVTQVAGAWVGLVDAEEFKSYLGERRKTANRPSLQL